MEQFTFFAKEKSNDWKWSFLDYPKEKNCLIPTQRSKPDIIDRNEVGYISKETIRNAQTFPRDYDFVKDTYSQYGYICDMSVPPVMIKRIVNRIIDTGVFK